MFATHLKLISVFHFQNFPHTIFIALFTLKYSHIVYKLNKKTIPQVQSNNEIREIRLSLVDFIYLVPLPLPKPILYGP